MRHLVATGALTLVLASGAAAASAQTPCDAYSGTCPPSPTVGGVATTRPAVEPSVRGVTTERGGVTLPLTGAQLTALLLVGTAAVAGGTSLVLSSRRGGKHE